MSITQSLGKRAFSDSLLYESLVVRLRQHADAARIKEKIGLATPMDVYRAELRLKDAEDSLSSAAQSLRDSRDQLKIILALPLKSVIDVSAPLEYAPIHLTTEQAGEIAFKNRVELVQANDAIRQTERDSRVAKQNTLPELNIVLDYGRFGSSDDFGKSAGLDETSWGIQFVSSTDIFRTTEKAAYRRSRINIKTALLNFDVIRDDIYRQTRTQLTALESLKNGYKSERKGLNRRKGNWPWCRSSFHMAWPIILI